MNHDKVIFLDIDGVLNSDASRIAANKFAKEIGRLDPITHIDETRVQIFNELVLASHAVVCLSTSWRIVFGFEPTIEMLTKKGLVAEIVGQTPKLYGPRFSSPPPPRGVEIKAWLKENPTRAFVVLDDERHAGKGHQKRLVHVPDGLTPGHVRRAIRILDQ